MKDYYSNLIYARSDLLDTLVRFGIIKKEMLTSYPISGAYRNRKHWETIYTNSKNDAQPF